MSAATKATKLSQSLAISWDAARGESAVYQLRGNYHDMFTRFREIIRAFAIRGDLSGIRGSAKTLPLQAPSSFPFFIPLPPPPS